MMMALWLQYGLVAMALISSASSASLICVSE